MPLTVAPPPRNGDAAQGNWSAAAPALPAADPVGAPTDAPEPSPTLPAPVVIARTVAAGVLLSAGALLAAAALVLLIAAVRLGFGGDVRLTFGDVSRVLIVSALAIACAGSLSAPLWPWPARRPLTLALATILTAAWPLSGAPGLAAVAAIAIVGLLLARDWLVAGGARTTSWPLAASLGCVATAFAIAGAALAEPRQEHPAAPRTAPSGTTAAETGTAAEAPAGAGAPSSSGKRSTDEHRPSGTDKAPAADGAPPAQHDAPKTPKGKAPDDPRIFVAPGLPGSSEAPADAPTPQRSAPPEPTPQAPSTDGAEAFVRDYYTAVDEQRFDDAWAVLPAGLRARFGGFERWKAGYAKTLSNTPRDIATSTKGDRVLVRLQLGALEQGCPIARIYSVTWTLGRAAGEWVVTGLRASADGPSSCG